MKIYLCYKFTWIEKDILLYELNWIRDVFDDFWFESFIFNLEYEEDTFDPSFVAAKMKEQITESDLILTYINYSQKSEWMLIEQWIAYSLNKKIAVFVKSEIKSNYFLTYWTDPDIIEYDEYPDFIDKLKKYLTLTIWRENIDSIDNQILELLKQRFERVDKIWKYKKYKKIPPLDESRRKQVLQQKAVKAEELWLNQEMVKNIWDLIHRQALIHEEKF